MENEQEKLSMSRNRKDAAGLNRRELLKTGLLTGGLTLLTAKKSFAAAKAFSQAGQLTPFIEELPISPIAEPVTTFADAPPNPANHQGAQALRWDARHQIGLGIADRQTRRHRNASAQAGLCGH